MNVMFKGMSFLGRRTTTNLEQFLVCRNEKREITLLVSCKWWREFGT